MKIDWVKTEYGTCDEVDKVPKGAKIEAVDDVLCVGICEVCEKPILETEDYFADYEGCYWHKACD
jgi:hypothetical protein